jgi:anti-anti-sigma factor
MLLKHHVNDTIDTVNLSGRLMMADANEVREKLKQIIEQGSGKLLIDLDGLTFIDSSGCSVLISAFKAIRTRQGRLVLCSLSPEIQSLIELTRLNEIFEIFAEKEAALSALQAG